MIFLGATFAGGGKLLFLRGNGSNDNSKTCVLPMPWIRQQLPGSFISLNQQVAMVFG